MYDKNCAGYWHKYLEDNKITAEAVDTLTLNNQCVVYTFPVGGQKKFFWLDETGDFCGPHDTEEQALEESINYLARLGS